MRGRSTERPGPVEEDQDGQERIAAGGHDQDLPCAVDAAGPLYQKPTRKYEQRPMTSQLR